MASGKSNSIVSNLVQREIARGNGKDLAKKARPGKVAGTIDKVAGVISPTWQRNRQLARMEGVVLAGGYDVTKPSRTRRSKSHLRGGSADDSQDYRTLWKLREICRDHDRNSSIFHGANNRFAENVAGPEYLFKPETGDKKFDQDAEQLLEEASAAAEFRGLFNLQDIIYTSVRSLAPDGDNLLLPLKDGKIQAVEAHELVTPFNGKGYKDRKVIGGVELDDRGRHTAYYIAQPNDKSFRQGWINNWKDVQRIEAKNAFHNAGRYRFSQTRAVPLMAPCLNIFERLDGYIEAETIAAQINANIGFGIKRDGSDQLPGTEAYDDPNSTTDSITTFEQMLRMEPGQIIDMLTNEDIVEIGGKRPTQAFEPYIVTVMRMYGAGIGMPLELILLDFSKTNYSSARAALLQAYRSFKRWQRFVRDWIIQRIYNWWVSRWIASGDLLPIDNAYKLHYFPPRWAWIDPLKEVIAIEKKIAAGAGTLADWVAEDANTIESLAETRDRELKLFRKKKIPTTTAPENLIGTENLKGEDDDAE